MEYLRHVAGAQGASASDLVHESAWALGAMASDPQALVLIVRRLVEKHPTCGPLWWLGAHVLTATDPAARLRELTAEYADDPTESHLAGLLAGVEPTGPIVEALGCGVDDGRAEVLIDVALIETVLMDDETVGDESVDLSRAVLVVRRGTVLPHDLWVAMKARAPHGVQVLQLPDFGTVVGPFGVVAGDHAVLAPECAPCPEMLVASGL
jgi:hypothetical protein